MIATFVTEHIFETVAILTFQIGVWSGCFRVYGSDKAAAIGSFHTAGTWRAKARLVVRFTTPLLSWYQVLSTIEVSSFLTLAAFKCTLCLHFRGMNAFGVSCLPGMGVGGTVT